MVVALRRILLDLPATPRLIRGIDFRDFEDPELVVSYFEKLMATFLSRKILLCFVANSLNSPLGQISPSFIFSLS
jgi:hypothetical protein